MYISVSTFVYIDLCFYQSVHVSIYQRIHHNDKNVITLYILLTTMCLYVPDFWKRSS